MLGAYCSPSCESLALVGRAYWKNAKGYRADSLTLIIPAPRSLSIRCGIERVEIEGIDREKTDKPTLNLFCSIL